jgi:hypothetical protein
MDEAQAPLLRRAVSLAQAINGIVVGQGEAVTAIAMGEVNQRRRRKQAVGGGRVVMQIKIIQAVKLKTQFPIITNPYYPNR